MKGVTKEKVSLEQKNYLMTIGYPEKQCEKYQLLGFNSKKSPLEAFFIKYKKLSIKGFLGNSFNSHLLNFILKEFQIHPGN